MSSSSGADYVTELMWTHVKMEIVYSAIELGVFDVLGALQKGLPVSKINEKIGAPNEEKLERLLNALVGVHLLEKSHISNDEGDIYKNTHQTSKYLITGPGSLTAFPVWQGYLKERGVQRMVHGILDKQIENRAKCDEDAASLFGHGDVSLGKDISSANRFQDFMDSVSYPATDFLHRLNLSEYKSAVDLGGSRGIWAAALAKKYPQMAVKVVELEDVVAGMEDYAKKMGFGQNLTFQSGDFFKGGLPKADLYLLGHIIHDWNDDKAQQILDNVKQALPKGGRIMLLEKVLKDDKTGPLPAVILDMHMMAVRGKERTLKEYSSLLESGGFIDIQFIENPGFNLYDFIIAENK